MNELQKTLLNELSKAAKNVNTEVDGITEDNLQKWSLNNLKQADDLLEKAHNTYIEKFVLIDQRRHDAGFNKTINDQKDEIDTKYNNAKLALINRTIERKKIEEAIGSANAQTIKDFVEKRNENLDKQTEEPLSPEEKSQLLKEVGDLKKEKTQLETERTSLRQKLFAVEIKNTQLKTDKKSLEAEKTQLQNDKRSLEAEKTQLQTDKKGLEEENTQLKTNKKDLETEKTQLNTDKNNLQQKLNAAELSKTQLEKELSKIKAERTKLQQDLDSVTLSKSILEKDCNSTQAKTTELQQELETIKESKNQIVKEVEDLKTEKTKIQGDLSSSNSEKTQFEEELNNTKTEKTQLQKDLETTKATKNQIEQELNKKLTEITSLKSELKSANSSKLESEQDSNKVKTENSTIQRELSQVKTLKEQLEQKLSSAKAELTRITEERNQLEFKYEEIEQSKNEIEKVLEETQSSRKQIEKELKDIREQVRKANEEKTKAKENIDNKMASDAAGQSDLTKDPKEAQQTIDSHPLQNKGQEEEKHEPTAEEIAEERYRNDQYQETMRKRLEARKREEAAKNPPSTDSANTSFRFPMQLKLDRIDLPVFSGNYIEWNTFKDLFEALVHNDRSLDDSLKLYQLRTHLRGPALDTIKGYSLHGANYQAAWSDIKKRYDRKETIVQEHIKKFIETPILTNRAQYHKMQAIIDGTNQMMRALPNLNISVANWDPFVTFIINSKLDEDTRRDWNQKNANKINVPVKEMLEFLENKAIEAQPTQGERMYQMLTKSKGKDCQKRMFLVEPDSNKESDNNKEPPRNELVRRAHNHTSTKCIYCRGAHYLFKCIKFLKETAKKRTQIAKDLKICFKCLLKHEIGACRFKECPYCNGPHNLALCYKKERDQHAKKTMKSSSREKDWDKNDRNQPSTSKNAKPTKAEVDETIILGTAQVIFENNENHKFRALCDNGSQVNLIAKSVVNKLHIALSPNKTSFIGIGGNNLGNAIGEATLKLKLSKSNSITAKFFVVKNITNYVPPRQEMEWKNHKIKLADKRYNEPGKIEVLLGLDVWIRVVEPNIIRAKSKIAIAQKTKFGYVIFKAENPYQIEEPYIGSIIQKESTNELLEQVKKLWELDKINIQRFTTREEKLCEEIFMKQHSRDKYGRYTVKIPFNEKLNTLGKSKNLALRQFFAMENRMKHNKELSEKYKDFMSEYLSLGHMELIHETEESGYYTPHHAVFSANKFRTVFNASARTSTGVTLNDTQMVGERLQMELFFILLNFRRYKFGITADIEKMYRQILIHQDHRKYQKILWRNSEREPVHVFQLKTVTYGHACAPHCAVRALIQCATDHELEFPLGAHVVKTCFYVDDLLTGADSQQEIKQIQNEVTQLLKKGGFNVTKWKGNEKSHDIIELKDEDVKSVLGLYWNVESDEFSFKLKNEDESNIVWTKRKILSKISRLYDPIGFLGPVIIRGKILIQTLWRDKLDWDEELAQPIQEKWNQYNDELKMVKEISINRWLNSSKTSKIQLHGFCDASEVGYGAAIYTRIQNTNGKIITSLLTSKSRVAPLKTTTIPRLELCSANLLIDLMHTIEPSFKQQSLQIFLWSDSRIVLCWCKKPPATLKVFVANRIANIQEKTDELQAKWKWISGKENPADLISRGTTVKELQQNKLWWTGPSWLSKNESEWPQIQIKDENVKEIIEKQEVKRIHLLQTNDTDTNELNVHPWYKYSSKNQKPFPLAKAYGTWNKLLRVTATIMRSCKMFKSLISKDTPISPEPSGNLLKEEMELAENYLIRKDQVKSFNQELGEIKSGKIRQIHKLCIIWDKEINVIRIDGRIKSENLTRNEQYPIILAKDGDLTELLIRDAHIRTLHGGNQLMLQFLRKRFWIIRCRQQIKNITKQCPKCFKLRIKTSEQYMASLPTKRTMPARAFTRIGVDYAGPVTLKTSILRRSSLVKAYIAVFVCLVTRAIHLELVTDATTEAFIAAFKRMISRRGAVQEVVSDNGTNFVGANNYLKELAQLIKEDKTKVELEFQITWNFITPNAPHHGGIYEAAVKSAKHHLVRIIGETSLTFEQYATVLCQTEACLNSRPLCALSDDPTNFNALTPGHFLIGEPLVGIPDPFDYTKFPTNRLNKYQLMQNIIQHFWKKWHSEYLTNLINRPKWKDTKRNLEPGDLVVVKEDNLPPLKWKIARVMEVYPGDDYLVRSVKIKTINIETPNNNKKKLELEDFKSIYNYYNRPVTKLGLLMSVEDQLKFNE